MGKGREGQVGLGKRWAGEGKRGGFRLLVEKEKWVRARKGGKGKGKMIKCKRKSG